MEKCYALKGQSLGNGLSYISEATGSILVQKVLSQRDSAQATEHKAQSKRNRSIRSQAFPALHISGKQCVGWARMKGGLGKRLTRAEFRRVVRPGNHSGRCPWATEEHEAVKGPSKKKEEQVRRRH